MHEFQNENIYDARFAKFIRKHFVQFYNVMHKHSKFFKIIVRDFSKRQLARAIQHQRAFKFDITNDFDIFIENEVIINKKKCAD